MLAEVEKPRRERQNPDMTTPMPLRSLALSVLAVGSVLFTASPASAVSDFEISVGLSYAHLEFDGADGTFESHDGVRFEPRVSASLIDDLPQLRLGAGLGISGFSKSEDDDLTFTDDDGDTFEIDGDHVEALTFVVPELQLSWRQPLGEAGNGAFFIEPGAAIGLLVASYNVSTNYRFFDSDEDIDESDTAFAARPFVRAGYAWDHFAAGLEVSYMIGGQLDLFGEVEGDPRELIIGGFFAYRF